MKHLAAKLTLALMLCSIAISAQIRPQIQKPNPQPTIVFTSTAYDFGKVSEYGGKVTHKFEFTNIGKAPITILGVSSTCGCTVPEWTKAPVAPGQKGYIDVAYAPLGRPGNFSKTLTVTSNAEPQKIALTISGNVYVKPTNIEEVYPYAPANSPLRFSDKGYDFGKVNRNETRTKEILVFNNSNKTVNLAVADVPKHISIKLQTPLLSKQEGKIICTYNAAQNPKWGSITDKFAILADGKDAGNILANVTIIPTEQELKQAEIKFDKNIQNFNTVRKGAYVNISFDFINTGRSKDLEIISVKSNIPQLKFRYPKEVRAGQRGKISVSFNTRKMHGEQNINIEVLTNSKTMPVSRLTLKGNVMN